MSDKTGKNILALMGVYDGHISGMIEIVKDLVSLGHNATCYVLEKYENRVKKSGAKLKVIPNPEIKLPPQAPQVAMAAYLIAYVIDKVIGDGLKSKEKYDYLLADSFFDANTINKFYKIKIVISVFIFPIGDANKFKFITENDQNRGRGFIPINKKYNIVLRDLLRVHYFPDSKYKFILTSKLFHPQSKVINNNSFFFLGPSIEERSQEISIDFKKDENKKLIYISLGTIFNFDLDFYKKCIEAFGNSKEFQVIISIGKLHEVKELGKLPENISAFNFVPQIKILKITDIFITHGGINSINEAVFGNKLPVIIIPQELDQIDNGNKIEQLKAGICLNKDNITPEILRNAVNNFMKNLRRFKAGVEKICQSFIIARRERKKVYQIIFA